jgi:Cytochrome C oxidase, cbb3-type, subunit III
MTLNGEQVRRMFLVLRQQKSSLRRGDVPLLFPLPSRERARVRGQKKYRSPSPLCSPVEGEEANNFRVAFLLRGSLPARRRSWRVQNHISSRLNRGLRVLLAFGFVVAAGCRQKMADQPRYEPLSRSTFFGDDRAARPLVEGTVARGQLRSDEHLYTGKEGGKLVDTFPFPVTRAVLARGQERFNIFCAPCHDRMGMGQGMVVRRGYRAPPSMHIDRLRQMPAGHLFDVMTNGFGVMPDYVQQIQPEDRWAIVAYIRALQLSQHATLADVPEDQRQQLGIKP